MASKGTSTFIMQRGTAVVMLPLFVWFLIGLIGQLGNSQAQMQSWLSQPVNGLLMAALVIIGAFHMRIGLTEIIDDYIHSGLRPVLSGLNTLVAVIIAGTAAISALSLVFA
jgi:succinate dehydrogenase / fumarate reductase membrane anchor subunit